MNSALNPAVNEENTRYAIHELILNYTFNIDLKNEPNDRAEYYLVEATTDKGLFLNETFTLGTYGAAVDSKDLFKPENFHFNRSDWFDTSVVTESGSGLYSPHNITFTSNLYMQGSTSQWTYLNEVHYAYPVTPLSKAILGAKTLTITVHRLGWTTFTNNSTIVTQTNEVIAQIQLEKFGDGFLYNNLIPADKLSQIDPASPVTFDPNTGQCVPKLEP